jgi:hypothetical protein
VILLVNFFLVVEEDGNSMTLLIKCKAHMKVRERPCYKVFSELSAAKRNNIGLRRMMLSDGFVFKGRSIPLGYIVEDLYRYET